LERAQDENVHQQVRDCETDKNQTKYLICKPENKCNNPKNMIKMHIIFIDEIFSFQFNFKILYLYPNIFGMNLENQLKTPPWMKMRENTDKP